MDIQTRLREFIEKRSKNKATREGRPSSPWWRRFSRFLAKYFKRQRKNRVYPQVQEESSSQNYGTESSKVQCPVELFLASSFKEKINGLPRQRSAEQEGSDVVADTTSGESHQELPLRKSIAWTVSLNDTDENPTISSSSSEPVDAKVLWNLVNADSSNVTDDEWASFNDVSAVDDVDADHEDRSALSKNLQSLQDYTEEMTYMLHRANVTWSQTCRGPFPHLKYLTKEQVIEIMSHDCTNITDRIKFKIYTAMKKVTDLNRAIDDHLGMQINFRDELEHDRELREKRPKRTELVWTYMEPKAFPTMNFKGDLEMVEEEVAVDASAYDD